MSSPIADLSYRNYDGPLQPPMARWWAIAKQSMKQSTSKRMFWIMSGLSAWFYAILLIVFYFMDTLSDSAAMASGAKNPFLLQILWKDQFLNAFSLAQLPYLLVALIIGVGTIANDNRSNALLVYLSKPCTKSDYLIGKWLGIFLPMTAIVALPTFLFYGYCLMSYQDYGFLTENPRLFLRLIPFVLVPGMIHASLSLGISSMFSQGRLAGATYAGLYVMTLFFTKAMQLIHWQLQTQDKAAPTIVTRLFYTSVDGIQIGLAKLFLGTDGSMLFPGMGQGRGGRSAPLPVPAPDAAYIVPLALTLCVVSIFIAWRRVRAVEVIG